MIETQSQQKRIRLSTPLKKKSKLLRLTLHPTLYYYKILKLAPVVQWIEHWSPEPKIWVRLPAGVPGKVILFWLNLHLEIDTN